MKEMRFAYKTEKHDLEIKTRKITEFLSLKVTRFSSR
jgi:translation initiation factor IF-3